MEISISIAGILGPTIIIMIFSEMKFWNPSLYDKQTLPLIYLNGALLFVAGLTIVRKHNIWVNNWQTLITILGYLILLLGVFRMFFPKVQKAEFKNNNAILVVQIILILFGLILTFKAYF